MHTNASTPFCKRYQRAFDPSFGGSGRVLRYPFLQALVEWRFF